LSGVETIESPRVSVGSLLPGPQALWIVSRGLCRCTAIDLPPVSRNKQMSAVALQLRQLSPFATTGAFVVAGDDRATAWYWDDADVHHAAACVDMNADDLWIVPEALMLPRGPDGVRLLACADGFEAQRWLGGVLVASQWWPREPTAADWSLFARQLGAAGADVSRSVPPAVEHPRRLRVPWATSALASSRGVHRRQLEKGAYVVLGAALMLWTSWLAGSWLKLDAEQRRIDAGQQRLSREAAPVVSARRAALDDVRILEAVAAVARQPDPRLVMAALAQALPAEGMTVADLELRDGKLRARLSAQSPNPPIGDLVERLNGSGWLLNAKASTESVTRTINLDAEVRPRRAGSS
jgi:hypothetical protein